MLPAAGGLPGLSDGGARVLPSAVHALAPLVAGLGLFFCGVRIIATSLGPLVGRALGRVLSWAVRRPCGAVLAGAVGGLLSQGTTAVILVVVSLVRSGAVLDRRVMLVPVWSHVGAAALVLLVAADLRLAVSYVLGVTGFALYFDLDRGERRRHAFQVLLGAGLLFLGVDLINGAGSPLQDELVQDGFLAASARYPALLALLGFGLAVATQSSTIASAIGVAVARTGMLDPGQVLLVILGANLGSAACYAALGRRGAAASRQVMLLQAVQKLAGSAVLSLLLATAALANVDAAGMLGGIADELAGQLALAFLLVQVAGSLACTALFGQLDRWLVRRVRPDPEEALGQPAHLVPEALANPGLALDLAAREAVRLALRLPRMLDGVTADAPAEAGGAVAAVPTPAVLREAGLLLGQAVRDYLARVLDGAPSHAEVLRAMRLEDQVGTLVALHETLEEFAGLVQLARAGDNAEVHAVAHMAEALHALMATLADAVQSNETDELDLVAELLGGRDHLMEEVRRRLAGKQTAAAGTADSAAAGDATLMAEPRVQATLLRATACFERALWLGRRCAVPTA